MTDDERTMIDDAQHQMRNYHQGSDDQLRQWENDRGEPKGYRIAIEYHDGSDGQYQAEDLDEAWKYIAWLDRRGGFKSAWRNGEPWLGDCTRDDIP